MFRNLRVDVLGAVVGVNAASATPTLAELQAYSAVLIYSDAPFFNASAFGNVLADYVDAGGSVTVATFATLNSGGITGRLVSGGYLPVIQGPQTNGATLTLTSVAPGHPLLTGVSSLNGGSSSFHNQVTLAAGATLVATWSNGTPLVAAKGNVVALNFYPPSSDARGDFWTSSTDGARLMVNSLASRARPPAAAAPVPVPTLSQWGLAGLSALMAAGTLVALRRRQRRA